MDAHLPELYGREYRRADPSTATDSPEVNKIRIIRPPSQAERDYEARVRKLEVTTGPYSQGLADPLLNLSYHQLERGDVDDAIGSLRRAIQLTRINDGLNTPSQLPLLQRLMQLYRDAGAYAQLSDTYSYYYHVSPISSEPVTEATLETALEYLDRERELYASRHDGAQRLNLLQAYEANHSMLEAAEGGDPKIYVALAMSQMRNLYLILGDRPLELAVDESSGRHKKLAAIQRTAYSKGLTLLRKCIGIMTTAPPRELAVVHLELGDWLQWNGKPNSAGEQYAQVVTLMEHAGEQELLAQWFDKPVELPDEADLWQTIHQDEASAPHIVEASYEVNHLGEPRRVKVRAQSEDGERQAGKIRVMLRDTHFRPRIGRDGPENGPRVTRYYSLIDAR